jgi:ABC-type antimicrobial peptide transport system permease subunit
VIVRSRTPAGAIAGDIAQRVERLNPGIAIHVSELKTQVRERLVNERMVAMLAGAFAILAMTLVIVGLYGIVAYLASSRKSEIGIRLALGSTRAQIVRLVLRDNVWMMAAGILIGLPLAMGAMRTARALLYGLSPTDGTMVAGATCLLAVAGICAAAIPAWRAARIRLSDAMRSE